MASRKVFKSISHNLLGSFVSRNHDLNGYWALGQLYTLSHEAQTLCVMINLLTAETEPSDHAVLLNTARTYTIRFQQALNAQGLLRQWVLEANLQIRFNTKLDPLSPLALPWRGEPFEARLSIYDDQQKLYRARHFGRCAMHNPQDEYQR